MGLKIQGISAPAASILTFLLKTVCNKYFVFCNKDYTLLCFVKKNVHTGISQTQL